MEKKVLLIADDDAMSRMIISKFLKSTYQIIEAVDGRHAMEILMNTHVDVLLLDIIMPYMDGLEVLTTIKERKELGHIGILVATSTKEKTERAALELGADDIVSKPYDPIVIKRRLTNILAVKELNKYCELQQNGDEEAVLEQRLSGMQQKIDLSVQQIRQCVRLIASNKENVSLLTEMLSKIETCTSRLEQVTKEGR